MAEEGDPTAPAGRAGRRGPLELVTGWSLLAFPLLLALGFLWRPDVEGSPRERLAAIGEDLSRWRVSWLLVLGASVLAVPAAAHLARQVRRPGDRLAPAAALVAALGAVALAVHAGAYGLPAAGLADDAQDPARLAGAAADLDDLTDGLPGLLGYGVLALALGVAVLGVLVYLRGPRPPAAGILIAAGAAAAGLGSVAGATLLAGAGAGAIMVGAISVAFPNPAAQEPRAGRG